MVVGAPTILALGVGGAFDTIILAVLIAVGLSELIGKTAEIVVGKEDKVYNYEVGEFVDPSSLNPSSDEKKITDSRYSIIIEEIEDEKD